METLTPSQQSRMVREMETFKQNEYNRLNLSDKATKIEHWQDDNPVTFSKEQIPATTVLVTGFPETSIHFLAKALRATGLNIEPFKTPGKSAYEIGKEYGNRGQCNPTYFTVGSLIEHLIYLRDVKKIPTQKIIKNYLYVTAGGCGPCRMGMYATEYRKALRDSGFKGFRVVLISRTGEVSSADSSAMEFTTRVIIKSFVSMMLADILNVIEKRMRPYERIDGSTDEAIQRCRAIIEMALVKKKSLLLAAYRCRKILKKITLDRTQVKPRILIQGEFWAKTTEGDGNYNLFRFLESEGAEASIETISDWILHQIWRAQWATKQREYLKKHDSQADGLKGVNVLRQKLTFRIVDKSFRWTFGLFAKILGLRDYKLTDNDELANLAHDHFDEHIDGGEDNMEIGHHIHAVTHNTANMVLSIKPFTCLSSNGVSDGIQPIISEMHAKSIFISVETDGDSPSGFYGRIQMQLFKAKKAAKKEIQDALTTTGITLEKINDFLEKHPRYDNILRRFPQVYSCVAANLVLAVGKKIA